MRSLTKNQLSELLFRWDIEGHQQSGTSLWEFLTRLNTGFEDLPKAKYEEVLKTLLFQSLVSGDVVTIKAVDGNWPEHKFRIVSVLEDMITGFAIDGPMKEEYGEPALNLVKLL
jgi:hypothetical protein